MDIPYLIFMPDQYVFKVSCCYNFTKVLRTFHTLTWAVLIVYIVSLVYRICSHMACNKNKSYIHLNIQEVIVIC